MTTINSYTSFPYSSTNPGHSVSRGSAAQSNQNTQSNSSSDSSSPTPNTSSTSTTNASSSNNKDQNQSSKGSQTMIQPAEPNSPYPTANAQKLQNNQLARQQELSNYKAVSFSNHGYKGNFIDTTS